MRLQRAVEPREPPSHIRSTKRFLRENVLTSKTLSYATLFTLPESQELCQEHGNNLPKAGQASERKKCSAPRPTPPGEAMERARQRVVHHGRIGHDCSKHDERELLELLERARLGAPEA